MNQFKSYKDKFDNNYLKNNSKNLKGKKSLSK